MAIRSSTYDYVMPSHLDDNLLIGTWLTKSEKISMERRFQVIRESDGQTIMRGRWDLVCIEISSGRPKRLPSEFTEMYKPAVVPVLPEQGT
jgi:acyl-CoA thioester hydrolase